MKKITPFFLAFIACAAMSCNEVSSDEISDIITPTVRCAMTGGVPIAPNQASVISSIIEVLNENGCWKGTEIDKNCSAFLKLQTNAGGTVSQGLNDGIKAIKASLGGGIIYFNSKPMDSVYKLAYSEVIASSGNTYCACGYDFCEAETACNIDDKTGLPICSYSRDAAPEFNESKPCDPVLIKQSPLQGILAEGLFPIMKKLGEYSSAEEAEQKELAKPESETKDPTKLLGTDLCVEKDNAIKINNAYGDAGLVDSPCRNEGKEAYLFYNTKVDKTIDATRAAKVYSFIVDCLNSSKVTETAKTTLLGFNQNMCSGNEVVLEGLRPGVINSGFYFNDFRRIAKGLLTDEMTTEELASIDPVALEEAVDEFLISEANLIFESKKDLKTVSSVMLILTAKGVNGQLIKATGYNNEGGVTIPTYPDPGANGKYDSSVIITLNEMIAGIKGFYENSYPKSNVLQITTDSGKTWTTKGRENVLRRKFFAALATYVMGVGDLNSAFGVNLECVSISSAIGDPAGMKKYCSADDKQPIGIQQIYNGLSVGVGSDSEDTSAIFNRINLIDALIMGDSAKIRTLDKEGNLTSVQINTNTTEDRIIYKRDNLDSSYVTYGGKWLAMRCPSGASCALNGQCGTCANTEIPQTLYDLDPTDDKGEKYLKHENSVCRNGSVVELSSSENK